MDDTLGTLARADAARLKAFAESLIADLGEVEVLQSRSGLVMLPMRDTARGVAFHLGEVLMSEAHIRKSDVEGYGMRCGHDLEASMAMA
ncbi:MAG: phosphonate C-P lyase system protein PhnG, partial [Pseudomonadota bacterium]